MANLKNKTICPTCKGNGYTVVPYNLAKKHEVYNVPFVTVREK
jgi:hypothetical protein